MIGWETSKKIVCKYLKLGTAEAKHKEWPDEKWRGCGPSGTGGGVDD